MVDAKEIINPRSLRLGNVLQYDEKLVDITNLSLDIDDEYTEMIGFCELGKSTGETFDWNRALAGKLRPIPLTPEILEKCGFSKCECGGWRGVIHISKMMIVKDGIEMKSLHQLQNYVYALTNTELKIEL